jgi:hypothetical protein
MCQSCRAHDRLVRSNKKLRDAGRVPLAQNGPNTNQAEDHAQIETEMNDTNNTPVTIAESHRSASDSVEPCTSATSSPNQPKDTLRSDENSVCLDLL